MSTTHHMYVGCCVTILGSALWGTAPAYAQTDPREHFLHDRIALSAGTIDITLTTLVEPRMPARVGATDELTIVWNKDQYKAVVRKGSTMPVGTYVLNDKYAITYDPSAPQPLYMRPRANLAENDYPAVVIDPRIIGLVEKTLVSTGTKDIYVLLGAKDSSQAHAVPKDGGGTLVSYKLVSGTEISAEFDAAGALTALIARMTHPDKSLYEFKTSLEYSPKVAGSKYPSVINYSRFVNGKQTYGERIQVNSVSFSPPNESEFSIQSLGLPDKTKALNRDGGGTYLTKGDSLVPQTLQERQEEIAEGTAKPNRSSPSRKYLIIGSACLFIIALCVLIAIRKKPGKSA